LIAGVVERAAEVSEVSSIQPVAAVEEVAPVTSQLAIAPQERDAPEGAVRATSPKIQETGEGSGAALPRDAEDEDARILDLAQVPWASAFEVGDDAEEDEESAACHTLERGLVWASGAFDELILPTMSVSFLCTTTLFRFFHSSEVCTARLPCPGQTLAVSGQRRARTVNELHAGRA
jgi:hypothetical protein